ncbi:LOW QUALITY PROTEIN: ataxin-7-like protein 2 [Dryobates pubescens]|uniref:LOW QUALITY PROTEIN: ataxin-7-like protein 2 n=1 Tax=Dryobates pubescens TaxID=118200 RepID=UPI0023B9035B|nr:LOW QUALITY PROTEIN: ataxin-7-like protein 2 [Dryobates pubescens]
MAAERRLLPSLDEFAGQSWSAWVERAGPAEPGAGQELEEGGKSSSKKLEAMTLIKEDMNIFGHCPAHDDFYLVVCNHCSQVVKPQAFQKHCERRHGPLSKLYARAAAAATAARCHGAVNGQPVPAGTPGTAKALREKPAGARGRVQPLPERPDKDLCLFVPVVNLEKIPSIPKADGHGLKVPPRAVPSSSREPSGKAVAAAVPTEPPVPAGPGGGLALPGPACQPEPLPAPGERDAAGTKAPPRSHKKLARKECDLNRQCGVLNPDTKKICTRLLTCKIHSVHQRREVQGRAKDFDVLVAELKASSRKGEPPKERSPPGKEAGPPQPPQDPSSLPQPLAGPPPCRAKQPHPLCPLPRTQLSSDSDPEDAPAASGEGALGVFPFPLPKGGNRVSSEESEEEGGSEEPPRPPTRPPRPQAFCTFGSRLVSPGCYVFNRRLDRFCSALGSMLERHLSSHMWRKIPPAAEPPLHAPRPPPSPAAPTCGLTTRTPSPPPRTSSSSSSSSSAVPLREGRVPTVGSPPAAAACSQPECGGGGSQSITSPLPANTPSPSFSKLPSTKASKASRAREAAGGGGRGGGGGGAGGGTDPDTRKRKPPLTPGCPPYKRTCPGDGGKNKPPSCQALPPPGKTKPTPAASPSSAILNGTTRVKRLPPPSSLDCRAPPVATTVDPRGSPLHGPPGVPPGVPAPPRCLSDDEVKKRKNSATYCRPLKPKPVPPPPPAGPPQPPPASAPPDSAGSIRRKKPATPPGFEEKRSALKAQVPLGCREAPTGYHRETEERGRGGGGAEKPPRG